jgi:hypothetical protein
MAWTSTWWVSFTNFTPDVHGGLQAANLLTSMARPADRYLSTGTRDFIEIDVRHSPPQPTRQH